MPSRPARHASRRTAHGKNVDRDSTSSGIPLEVQQWVLGIFRSALRDRFSADLQQVLQEIKGHLYARDFYKAFATREKLEAYAVRWSSSRALAYLSIFHDAREYLMHKDTSVDSEPLMAAGSSSKVATQQQQPESSAAAASTAPDSPHQGGKSMATHMNVACLGGGGGAEAVALAGYARHMMRASGSSGSDVNGGGPPAERLSLSINIIDVADWSTVLRQLEGSIIGAAASNDASTSTSTSNKTLPPAAKLSPDQYTINFHQGDLLSPDISSSSHHASLIQNADLITLMFTLNELYTASLSRTTSTFLLDFLTPHAKPQALLLVVDSPGSYSTVRLGDNNNNNNNNSSSSNNDEKSPRTYPMHFLLDHTLLDLASTTTTTTSDNNQQPPPPPPPPPRPAWQKLPLHHHDPNSDAMSRWFRLPPAQSQLLRYPLPLENTRYQVHLYRRV